MSDNVHISGGGLCIAISLLIIYFWGDPDMHDLIQELVREING